VDREAFLAGEATDSVAIYLASSAVDGIDTLAERSYAEDVAGGVVLVVPGERGRALLPKLVGEDAMEFAGTAMRNESHIERDLTGGDCPDADEEGDHAAELVFAFAEDENEEVGGQYAEGDVIHAYARCTCGTTYSERWVVE
jgi:hypothetical protein